MTLFPVSRFGLSRTLSEVGLALQACGQDWPSSTGASFWAPRVNVRETGEGIEVSADLPGVKKEDLSVLVENNMLYLRGTRRNETEGQDGNWRRVEKVYGTFERAFSLPAGLSRDEVSAALKDGILTVRIPKQEQAKPRTIEITVED